MAFVSDIMWYTVCNIRSFNPHKNSDEVGGMAPIYRLQVWPAGKEVKGPELDQITDTLQPRWEYWSVLFH